jgi:predicted metal-binding membrane protein
MTYEERQFARVRYCVLLVTALTWVFLIAQPHSMAGHAYPHAVNSAAVQTLATDWALMVVAMMAPLLIPSIQYVRQRSFKHRRARAVALFMIGYGALWMTAGAVVLAIETTVKLFAPMSFLPAAGAALIALVWQFSPIKQRALNRCHAHTELAAFGAAADLALLRFGLIHGVWCVISCWALMLFPMLLPSGRVAAMAVVAFLLFSERLDRPMRPSWRFRGLTSAKRMVVARARTQFGGLRADSGVSFPVK